MEEDDGWRMGEEKGRVMLEMDSSAMRTVLATHSNTQTLQQTLHTDATHTTRLVVVQRCTHNAYTHTHTHTHIPHTHTHTTRVVSTHPPNTMRSLPPPSSVTITRVKEKAAGATFPNVINDHIHVPRSRIYASPSRDIPVDEAMRS